ncbi:MAG: YihA family ribosome biogenesis GTP-binding protein [Chitinophagales bacterium]|jgi:GTP-binding protein|nr:YihA family ribosome biogenesis GTP-binding protein [Chitinophagales bacterium]
MIVRTATFIGSYVEEKKCPANAFAEFAFIGRSNVGKSSLINMLCNRKDLVKISRSPGKTQTLNFFLINNQFFFVDLPGYGYAKVSREMRKKWELMIEEYLTSRKTLQLIFALIDARHEPQKIDLEFVNQLTGWELPFALVFTKCDKAGKSQTWEHVHQFHDMLRSRKEAIPETFITSADTRAGKEEMLGFIEHLIENK